MSTKHIQTDNKTAFRPTGCDGTVVLHDGYDDS